MSVQNALDFLSALDMDDTVNAALAQCTSLEDVQLTAEGMGYGFSVDNCAERILPVEHAAHPQPRRLARSVLFY